MQVCNRFSCNASFQLLLVSASFHGPGRLTPGYIRGALPAAERQGQVPGHPRTRTRSRGLGPLGWCGRLRRGILHRTLHGALYGFAWCGRLRSMPNDGACEKHAAVCQKCAAICLQNMLNGMLAKHVALPHSSRVQLSLMTCGRTEVPGDTGAAVRRVQVHAKHIDQSVALPQQRAMLTGVMKTSVTNDQSVALPHVSLMTCGRRQVLDAAPLCSAQADAAPLCSAQAGAAPLCSAHGTRAGRRPGDGEESAALPHRPLLACLGSRDSV